MSGGSGLGLGGLSAGARALTAFAVALGTFMQVLDTTIANVSIPVMSGNLGVSADQGTWVITSFAVANGISVPLTGWLMQRFGLVRTFTVSVVLFTVASFMCGMAWNLPSLIAFRVLQGVVSGPLIPGSQAILLSIFPPERRARALGIWTVTTLIAPVIGPILGGWISDNYSWPWIFLINLPVGIFSAIVCWRYLGKRDTPTRRLPVDRVGISLLVVWVGSLQILLDLGKDADWFASPAIVVLALVAAIGFIAFLIWELTERHPIVDLTLFRSRDFTIGTIVVCIGYALFFGNLVLLPLWLQTQLGYTATWAGLITTPSGVIAILLVPFVGRALGRVDARLFATVAMLAFAASFLMRARLTTDATVGDFMVPLAIQGIAMATFFIAGLTMTLNKIPPERVPAASGMSNFLRISAGSFAASIVTTFWDRHAAFHQTRLVEKSTFFDTAFREAHRGMEALGLSPMQAMGALEHGVSIQAYAKSAIDFFWLSGWLSLGLIGLIWFAHSTVGRRGPPVAAAD
ncbi:MAG: DHA2 family efflux MFS transporter permease subunit [Pseudomonadota bacterium]